MDRYKKQRRRIHKAENGTTAVGAGGGGRLHLDRMVVWEDE